MRLLPACLAASLLLALASPALAGGPPGSVEPNYDAPVATPTHTVRYGKEIVLADLVWLGATALIANSGAGEGASLIGLGYFATGPLIHLRHGNGTGAAKSLAARTLLPAAGMLVGGLLAANAEDHDDYEEDEFIDDDGFAVLAGAVLGGMVGMVSAVVLDWTTFSKKTVEGRPASWAAAPNVNVNRHGATVGVSGSF